MSRNTINAGDVFGQLTVTVEAEPQKFPSGQYKKRYRCQCACGNSALVLAMYLVNGHTTSCGCARVREYEGKTLGRYQIGSRTGERDTGGAAEYNAMCIECGTWRKDSISTLRKAGARVCTCGTTRPGVGENERVKAYRQTATGRAVQLQSNARRRAEEKRIPFDLDRCNIIERITGP